MFVVIGTNQSHRLLLSTRYNAVKMIRNIMLGVLCAMTLLIQSADCLEPLNIGQHENTTSKASGRFLSLFSVVRFANSFCYGSNGLNGTCYTAAECTSLGGTASGSCASGFGVCCTICITTCGKTATANNTYWGNPGYPSGYSTAGQCNLNVKTSSSDICQMRLDFINFVTHDPDGGTVSPAAKTQCQIDLFTVSGQSNNVPGICGTNTNQHMYLDLAPGTSQITLNMLLSDASKSRTWKIRISQIPCGTDYTAPDNCLQWFTTSVGTFSTFNYQFVSDVTTPVQHLANQDYTICIRMNEGFCGICYSTCDVQTTAPAVPGFSLSGSAATAAFDTACTTDWIIIPCATDQQSSSALQSDGTTACVSKICGGAFSSKTTTAAPVYSYRKPFEVRVYTDSNEVTSGTAETKSVGFCLKYQQLTCSSG